MAPHVKDLAGDMDGRVSVDGARGAGVSPFGLRPGTLARGNAVQVGCLDG